MSRYSYVPHYPETIVSNTYCHGTVQESKGFFHCRFTVFDDIMLDDDIFSYDDKFKNKDDAIFWISDKFADLEIEISLKFYESEH